MSRRTRYTPEQKVKIVTACIDGENSIRGIARQYRISGGRIASVPGPGGIIAEFIGYAQEKTLAKRQQEMFDLINIRLNRLQDRIDELASNEFCVTIAQKTYGFRVIVIRDAADTVRPHPLIRNSRLHCPRTFLRVLLLAARHQLLQLLLFSPRQLKLFLFLCHEGSF